MSRYAPGQYHVQRLDRLGEPLPDLLAGSYNEARSLGEASKSRGECHAYIVHRVLYSSLEPPLERYDVVVPAPPPAAPDSPVGRMAAGRSAGIGPPAAEPLARSAPLATR